MARSTLDPDNVPAGPETDWPPGHDIKSIGPSDSSDSGSDMAGPGLLDDEQIDLDRGTNEDSEGGIANVADAGASVGDLDMDSTSDSSGTGERMAAGKEPNVRDGGDIGFDRIVSADQAGLGGGLDQAEEANLGITDEEIDSLLGDDEDDL